ncbi:MAG TPA: fibronectin type III domain-containing protein [Acidimicrobiales bacterium]|nr:fibronectin type III domain-containing protein [Acidimicrobiales bacterium]
MTRLSFRHHPLAKLAVAAIAVFLVTGNGLAGADPSFADAHPVNGLAALNVDGTALVDGISCSSNGNCGAIGTYTDGSRLSQGFVVTETGDVWGTAEPIPGLIALNAHGNVDDVMSISCTATGECSASGDYLDANSVRQVFLVTEHGGSWGSAVTLPRDPSLPASLAATSSSISCASPGNCVAGGFYLDGAGTATQSWVATQTGGTWANAIELPGTATLNQGILGTVVSIACPAVGSCAATGIYTDSSNHFQAYVDSETSGTWGTAVPVPGLVSINTGGFASANQLVCSSVGRCAIGGGYTLAGGAGEAFVADETGGVWGNAIEVPGSVTLNTGQSAIVDSIACPSDGSCEAVGVYEDSSQNYHAMVASESGGVWGPAAEMPGTAALNVDGAAEAYDVSCVSAGDCRAVGYYLDGSNNYQAFVATESGGVWAGSVEAPGSAALNTEGDAELTVVSCTSDGACSAAGQYKDSAGSLQGMILDASTAPATAPAAPGVSAASHAKGKITVTVHPGSNGGDPVTAYQYSLNGGPWRKGSSGGTRFVVSHLKSKSKVHVRVRAVNAVGPSGPSRSVTVKVK